MTLDGPIRILGQQSDKPDPTQATGTMTRAIGIDLGTTNSCAAVIEGNQPKVIMYRGGSYAIPSILAVDPGGELLVGHDARKQAAQDPDSAVFSPKRLLGQGYHSPEVDEIRRLFTHNMVESESGEVLLKIQGRVFDLTEVSARILMKIKEIAEDCLGEEVGRAVITVPAYFNAKQRRSIRQAGLQAGLEVLRILNEPTAAALAYGLGRDLRQRLAVFDLGGGTLDLSIIEIRDKVFEVLATGGDAFLGGLDFDDRVIRYAVEDFQIKTGVDLREDRVAIQRIREAAERAKIELSTVETTQLEVPFLSRGEKGVLGLDMTLSRAELEDLTADLVDRAVDTTRELFEKAAVDFEAIDEVLLVGGQSRMPLVRRKVRMLFQKEPCRGVHPDEAVAVGASIMAHSLAQVSGAQKISLLDALPLPVGIAQVDESFLPIFPKDCPLPHVRRLTLTNSKADQKTIMLKLFRGEKARASDNALLGTFVFSGFEPRLRGEVKLQVWLTIDTDGLLSVRASDRSTTLPVDVGLKGPDGLIEPVLSLTTESRRGELLDTEADRARPGPISLEQPEPRSEAAPAAQPEADLPSPTSREDSTPAVPETQPSPLPVTEDTQDGESPVEADDPETEEMPAQTMPEAETPGLLSDRRRSSRPPDEDDEDALLEALVNETRPMEGMSEDSISPVDEMGSVWDEGRDRASAGGAGAEAAAESIEGDEEIGWFALLLPWNWWK